MIAVAAEERGTGLGRIRMQRVQNASAASLMPFVEESVEPGSVVVTDNWSGYDPLKKKDYQRRIISINNRREQASQLLPRVHLAISLLKRWMLGFIRGRSILDYYLDEFVFRQSAQITQSGQAAGHGGGADAYRSIVPIGTLRRCGVNGQVDTRLSQAQRPSTARIRQKWNKDDGRFLKEDGGNLAPFLYRLRESKPKHYKLILDTVRHAAPFFADFVLEPEGDSLLLQWQERNSDLVFGSHQASDGTLRFIALCSLLLQPEDELPDLIILDEPELGLHPGAIAILAGLLKSASIHTGVVLATQSTTVVDHFDPEDIIVVDRVGRHSTFRRLEAHRLSTWLDEYSLGELWEKNVIGGRPSA